MEPNTAALVAHHAAVTKFLRSTAVAHLWEGRCAWLLEPRLRSFVLAAEGAPVDGALVITPPDYDLPAEPSDRLDHVLDNLKGQRVLCLVDMKTIEPRACADWKGDLFFYNVGARKPQRACAAFLVQNPAAPHLAALIPQHYLTRGKPDDDDAGYGCYSKEIPWWGEQVEYFPMEWGAFVMPFRKLGAAMESLEAYCRGTSDVWRNPHNDIVFRDYPIPTLYDPSLLIPDESSDLTDQSLIRRLRDAFRLYSSSYRVERLTIRPSVGDFRLVHLASGRLVTVEVKQTLVSITPSPQGKIVHYANHPQNNKSIFSSTTLWDWLLSVTGNQALFVNRDQLPDHFFGPPVIAMDSPRLEWTPPVDVLRRHVVRLPLVGHLRDTVCDMETALNARLQAGMSLAAVTPRRLVPPSPVSTSSMEGSADSDDEVEVGQVAVARRRRGAGRESSFKDFNAKRMRWLAGLCAKKGRGTVYCLGDHPSASHALVAGRRTDGQPPPSFLELEPYDRIILLNFYRASSLEQRGVVDHRAGVKITRSIFGSGTPSILIFSPYPEEFEGLNLLKILVPSPILAGDPARQKDHREATEKGWGRVSRGSRPLVDHTNRPIEDFTVREEDVLDKLYGIFEARPDRSGVEYGTVDEISPRDYVISQRRVLEQILLAGDN